MPLEQNDPDLSSVYAISRARLIDLATRLDPAAAEASVGPTPLWHVTDVYRHLAGLADDVLTGRLDGVGTPAWTAAQVAAFRDLSLADVCTAWAAAAAAFDAKLAAAGQAGVRIAGDVWNHEQDVRAAVGLRGIRDDRAAAALGREYVHLVTERWADHPGTPSVEIVVDGEPLRFGPDEPELTLRTSSYEFVRAVVGRRSHAQLLAADWSGPAPERVFTVLSRFDLPVADVLD